MTNKNQSSKQPFNIDTAIQLMEEAVEPYPKAGLFELVDEGFGSTFQLLAACIISIRTRDEVMIPVSRQLFEAAPDAAAVAQLGPRGIDALIEQCAFHANKAEQIHAIAERTATEFDGDLPCDFDILTSFKGVGPKCANLVLGIGCDDPQIGVDIHVHRITNRWGYVAANTPEKTMVQLEAKLPKPYWVEINRLGVPFGKHICQGRRPKCDVCPLLEMCQQVGV